MFIVLSIIAAIVLFLAWRARRREKAAREALRKAEAERQPSYEDMRREVILRAFTTRKPVYGSLNEDGTYTIKEL